MLSRLILSAALLISLPAQLPAQQNNMQHRQQFGGRQQVGPQATEVQIDGAVEGVLRGVIGVIDANNQSWRIAIGPMAKVQVTGKANADFLQTGLVVEFEGESDNRGVIKEKVSELKLVTQSAEKQLGLFPIDTGGEKPSAEAENGGKAGKPKGAAGKGAGVLSSGKYRVVGRLLVGRGGKLSVRAGRYSLTFELSDQPKITVDFYDYLVAAKGDKVSIKAVKMNTRAGPAIAAMDVKIELAEPLSGTRKKSPLTRSDIKRPSKALKKEDEPSKPADK